MNRIKKNSFAFILAGIILSVLMLGAEVASAETIEGKFYTFDTETGIMRVFGDVPDIESGGWYKGPADGAVKEVIFEETEDDINIGDHGFDTDAFRNLEKVTFSSSVKSIGDRAFIRGQYKFPDFEIVFPESGLETIGENVFSENHATVETLKLPSTLKSVGAGAFNMMNIKHLQISPALEYVGPWAFGRTEYFDDSIGANYACMGGALYNRDMTTLIEYPYVSPTGEYEAPKSLKTIAKHAFYETKYLKALILPEGFERIEDEAFKMKESYDDGDYNISFDKFYTIVIPTTLEYIGTGNQFSYIKYYFYRGTKDELSKIKDNKGEPYYSSPSDSHWHFYYDVESATFPEEITLRVGEQKPLVFSVSPGSASSEEAKENRMKAYGNTYWSGSIKDINNSEIIVYDADCEDTYAFVEGKNEGTAVIGIQALGRYRKCIIHVEGTMPSPVVPQTGDTVPLGGASYQILDAKQQTAAFKSAPNTKSVTVPKTFTYAGNTYKVTQVAAGAFKKSKATSAVIGANVKTIKKYAFKGSKVKTVTVKTKKLTKSSVKGSLKNSKVTTVKVKVGIKSANKKYVAKYKKIFTKKIAGKKVAVK